MNQPTYSPQLKKLRVSGNLTQWLVRSQDGSRVTKEQRGSGNEVGLILTPPKARGLSNTSLLLETNKVALNVQASNEIVEESDSTEPSPSSSQVYEPTPCQPIRQTQFFNVHTALQHRQLRGFGACQFQNQVVTGPIYRFGFAPLLPGLVSLPEDIIHIAAGSGSSELGRPGDSGTPVYSTQYAKGAQQAHLLAIGDENGRVAIVDARRFARPNMTYGPNQISGWSAHSDCIMDVIWCQNDTNLLTGSGDELAMLWDVETKTSVARFAEHSGTIRGLASHPIDFNLFATASRDGSLRLWDTRCSPASAAASAAASNTNQTHPHFRSIDAITQAHVPGFIATNPNKRSSSRRSSFYLEKEAKHAVTSVVFLPHYPGSLAIASAGASDGAVKVWDVRQLGAHKHKSTSSPVEYNIPSLNHNQRAYGISSLVLDASGCTLYATCLDSSIYSLNPNRLNNPAQARLQASTFKSSVYTRATLSPNGQFLASGSVYETIQIWDLSKTLAAGFGAYTLHGHTREVSGVSWSASLTNGLASLSDDCTVRLWRFDSTLKEGPVPRTSEHLPMQADIGFTLPPNTQSE